MVEGFCIKSADTLCKIYTFVQHKRLHFWDINCALSDFDTDSVKNSLLMFRIATTISSRQRIEVVARDSHKTYVNSAAFLVFSLWSVPRVFCSAIGSLRTEFGIEYEPSNLLGHRALTGHVIHRKEAFEVLQPHVIFLAAQSNMRHYFAALIEFKKMRFANMSWRTLSDCM